MSHNHENQNFPSTEERILKAAEKEFLEKGYAGARTTSIASAAGVTHAMLHYYFRTKERLFEQIVEEKVKLLRGLMLTPLLNPEIPLLEKVRTAVETHLDFLAANPELPGFMISVLSGNPEFEAILKDKVKDINIVEILQQEIDKGAETGVCRKTDARMLMLDIISLNVFSFVGGSIIKNVIGPFQVDDVFIEERKKNNVEMIMQKLIP